jgi:hypothetical protein
MANILGHTNPCTITKINQHSFREKEEQLSEQLKACFISAMAFFMRGLFKRRFF